jgi:hypothetical protein
VRCGAKQFSVERPAYSLETDSELQVIVHRVCQPPCPAGTFTNPAVPRCVTKGLWWPTC